MTKTVHRLQDVLRKDIIEHEVVYLTAPPDYEGCSKTYKFSFHWCNSYAFYVQEGENLFADDLYIEDSSLRRLKKAFKERVL